eukprot:6185576-Pleurochrysis_carterae.AAC.1
MQWTARRCVASPIPCVGRALRRCAGARPDDHRHARPRVILQPQIARCDLPCTSLRAAHLVRIALLS